MAVNRVRYEQDLVAWAEEQASLLRSGELEELDREHLAEEIEGLSSSERRELRRRLARLLQHLLKLRFRPELRSRSWATTIQVQRDEIKVMLDDSPSLGARLPDMLPMAFRLARGWAQRETGILNMLQDCAWSVDQILTDDFLPES